MELSRQIESPAAAIVAIQDVLASQPLDLPATSKRLSRILKTLQHLLQQNKISAAHDARLVPCLQLLMPFGYDHPEPTLDTIEASSTTSFSSPLKRYIPPAARKSVVGARPPPPTGSSELRYSDSDASDVEGGSSGNGIKSSRVRFLAMTCLQILIKTEPKALHPLWPALLPEVDANLSSKEIFISSGTPATLAHILLLDDSARVRHSAAATISTLLEGPAQRAYLAVAELKAPASGRPVRGFVPLSATLGGVIIGTHHALLRALRSEQDLSVLAGTLRALGTALMGTPYSRLPPDLLRQCVEGVGGVLLKAQHAQQDAVSAPHWISILSGSLSCLAAAFSAKPPSICLANFLMNATLDQEGGEDRGGGTALVTELVACSSHSSPAVQLEAIMALRGLVQQYQQSVQQLWTEIFHLATASVVGAVAESSSTGVIANAAAAAAGTTERQQQGTNNNSNPRERVAQQSILLLGDYLRASPLEDHSSRWEAAVLECIRQGLSHQSPLLRAAGFGAISGISPASAAALAADTRTYLFMATCKGASEDEFSPVRAAAARALEEAVPSLLAACNDEVVAVRVQAAGALAATAEILLTCQAGSFPSEPCIFNALELLLPAAVQAAADGDKVKPSAATALGSLLSCSVIQAAGFSNAQRDAFDSLKACLLSENSKVQWSACSAAGKVLSRAKRRPGAKVGLEYAAVEAEMELLKGVLEDLQKDSENSRTRTLAKAALVFGRDE